MNCYNEFSVGKCGNADLYFLVDTEYAEEISKHVWTLDGYGYPCRNDGGKTIRMHTWVIEQASNEKVPEGVYVDHINKCKRDNRLCNLRIVTPEESSTNMPLKANNTSGVTGVSKGRDGKGYRAYITVKKKRIELGTFQTKSEAIKARLEAEERFGYKHAQNVKEMLDAFLIEMEDE